LPFASVGWETPIGTYSISSMSAIRRSSAVATDPQGQPLALLLIN
jgi:hypothetical protein